MTQFDADAYADLKARVTTAEFCLATALDSVRRVDPDSLTGLFGRHPDLRERLDEWRSAHEAYRMYVRETTSRQRRQRRPPL